MSFKTRLLEISIDPNACWLWRWSVTKGGYALAYVDGRTVLAHREAYKLLIGPIAAGLTVDHLCRVRNCLNPSHMELVTTRENTLRGGAPSAQNARKTHCAHGHEFTSENTYTGRGYRACRACARDKYNRIAQSPDFIERRRKHHQQPEVKAKRAEYYRAHSQDPAVKARRAKQARLRRADKMKETAGA